MEKGEIDRALFDFDHAIELDPMDADARVGRGRAYYRKKDYAAALTDYDAATRLVPNNPEALAERGDANERAGLYDRAAEDYGRLIEIEPGNAKARFALRPRRAARRGALSRSAPATLALATYR
jgi:tetratricopeptide (TPR) repeat protein